MKNSKSQCPHFMQIKGQIFLNNCKIHLNHLKDMYINIT